MVVQTDKSSKFAVMSLESYEKAGAKHTAQDEEVDLEYVIRNERHINGHMSMILKMFMVGATWSHEDRIRATKITHSLSVAPMYILYKDHKGWTVVTGGPPPTRPVASAGGGQNDNMSETVSLILEPVANTCTGGMETKSTPGFVSKIVKMNEKARELEEIDLEEIDKALDEEAKMKDTLEEMEAEMIPEERVGDEPEEVRRARTTGGTLHQTSQERKEGTQPGEENEAKCDCKECAQGEEVLEDGERFLEDERTQEDTKLRDKIPEEPEKNENFENSSMHAILWEMFSSEI